MCFMSEYRFQNDIFALDRGFKPRSGQTKDYEIDICFFSAKYTALRKKS